MNLERLTKTGTKLRLLTNPEVPRFAPTGPPPTRDSMFHPRNVGVLSFFLDRLNDYTPDQLIAALIETLPESRVRAIRSEYARDLAKLRRELADEKYQAILRWCQYNQHVMREDRPLAMTDPREQCKVIPHGWSPPPSFTGYCWPEVFNKMRKCGCFPGL